MMQRILESLFSAAVLALLFLMRDTLPAYAILSLAALAGFFISRSLMAEAVKSAIAFVKARRGE